MFRIYSVCIGVEEERVSGRRDRLSIASVGIRLASLRSWEVLVRAVGRGGWRGGGEWVEGAGRFCG